MLEISNPGTQFALSPFMRVLRGIRSRPRTAFPGFSRLGGEPQTAIYRLIRYDGGKLSLASVYIK
jgi:hypothetical protein